MSNAKCIVFSTHHAEVARLCDDVVLVSHGRTVARGTVAKLNAQSGEHDFEETFVKLAFSAQEKECIMMPSLLTTAWRVFRKELLDALRDRRTLLMVALSSVYGSGDFVSAVRTIGKL